jgi:hypothetical protein
MSLYDTQAGYVVHGPDIWYTDRVYDTKTGKVCTQLMSVYDTRTGYMENKPGMWCTNRVCSTRLKSMHTINKRV